MEINYDLSNVKIECRHIHTGKDELYSRDETCIGGRCKYKMQCDQILKYINKAKTVWFSTQPIAKIDYPEPKIMVKEESSIDRLKKFQPIVDMIKFRDELKKRTIVTRNLIKYIAQENLCTEDAEIIYSQVQKFSIVKPHPIEINYITNSRGAEDRVKFQLEKMGRNVPKIKLTGKVDDNSIQKAQVKKFMEKKENPLVAKIKAMGENIETITIE